METTILANTFVFVILAFIGTVFGLDLKKLYSWLLGLYGFLSGSLIGLLRADGSLDFQLGVLLAFAVMFGGSLVYSYRQRYNKDAAASWVLKYGQEKQYSFLTRILKKLLNK